MEKNNIRVTHQKHLPKRLYDCEMCGDKVITKPYELEFISLVGAENNKMIVCRKCGYKELYGSKKMKKAIKEKTIEQEKTN